MSEDVAIETDPFAPSAPDEMVELRTLAQAIGLASGFKLIFARCNQPAQQRKLIDEVRKELPDLTIQEVHLTEPVEHLLDALRERVSAPAPDAVMVTGLERSLPTSEKALASPFIANLNASRNSFPTSLPLPVVLWLPEYALTAMIRRAPDFFSIRSGVYYFAASVDETAGIARFLTDGDEYGTLNLSRSEKQERIKAIESLLADYAALPPDRRNYKSEVRLHERLGVLLGSLGYHDASLTHFEQSLKIAEKIVDLSGMSSSLHNIGIIHQERGEYEKALAKYEESLKIVEELDDHAGVASSLNEIGIIHQNRGEYETALAKYEEALKLSEALGNHAMVAISLHQIGNIHYLRGEYETALAKYEESLKIKERLGNHAGIAASRGQIGELFARTGRYQEAFENSLFALSVFTELGSPDAQVAIDDLRKLRAEWGAENFDAAWLEATGEAVPEWIKDQSSSPPVPTEPTPIETNRV